MVANVLKMLRHFASLPARGVCWLYLKPCSRHHKDRRVNGFGLGCVTGTWQLQWGFWIRTLILFVLLLWLYELDPFGLSSLSERKSETLYQQWSAPYRSGPREEQVSVVVLSDQQLKELRPQGGSNHELHGRVLERLLEVKPKAVFVDLGFVETSERDRGWTELLEVVSDYQAQGVPLFFAADVVYDGKNGQCWFRKRSQQIQSELLKHGAQPVLAPGGGADRQGLRYPLGCELTMSPVDRVRARRLKPVSLPGVSGVLRSAAPAICGGACDDWLNASLSAGSFVAEQAEPLFIRWRLAGQSTDNREGAFFCNDLYTGFVSRLWHSLNLWHRDDPEKTRHVEQSCPPQPSLSVQRLLYSTGAERREVDKLLGDRAYVIYGAYMAFAEDVVDPPVHTLLPGAFHHAMALENLFVYRSNFYRDTPVAFAQTRLSKLFEYSTFFVLLLILEYTRFINVNSRDMKDDAVASETEPRFWQRLFYWVFLDVKAVLVVLAVLAFSVLVCAELVHQPVPDFIGLLSLLSLKSLPTFYRWWERFKSGFCEQPLGKATVRRE